MIMNFKDAYKNMTDEIGTNKELLDSLTAKASNRKNKVWYFRKSYAVAVAAMLIFAVGAGFMSKTHFDFFHGDIKTDDGYVAYDMRKKTVENKASPRGEKTVLTDDDSDNDIVNYPSENTMAAPKNIDDELPKMSEVSETPSFDISDTLEPAEDSGNDADVELDDGSEFSVPEMAMVTESEADCEMATYDSDNSVKEKTSSSGGGGGGSASYAVSDTVSIEEYWEYIGFDVLSNLNLPYDIKLFSPSTVVIRKQGDEIFYDTLSVYGESPDSLYSLNIFISKKPLSTTTCSTYVKGAYVGICSDTLSDAELSEILSFQ